MKKIKSMSFESDIIGTTLAKLVSVIEGDLYCYRPVVISTIYDTYYAKSLQLQEKSKTSLSAYIGEPKHSYETMHDKKQIILLDKQQETYLKDTYGFHYVMDSYMDIPLVFSKEIDFTTKDLTITNKWPWKNTPQPDNSLDGYFAYVNDFVNDLIDYCLANNKYTNKTNCKDNIPLCTLTEEELMTLLKEYIIKNENLLLERRKAKLKKLIDDFNTKNNSLMTNILGDFSLTRKKTVSEDDYE